MLMAANRGDWFGDSPGVLRMFARLGLRMITIGQATRELGWDTSDETRSGGRMTELGVRMIGEMNRCSILTDLAHTNDPCALDIIEASGKPVVDTHSNPRSLDPGDRSAPNDVMRALAQQSGMLGIVPTIGRPEGDAPYQSADHEELEQTLKYVDYAVDVIGVDHVGIGAHFNSALLPFITAACSNQAIRTRIPRRSWAGPPCGSCATCCPTEPTPAPLTRHWWTNVPDPSRLCPRCRGGGHQRHGIALALLKVVERYGHFGAASEHAGASHRAFPDSPTPAGRSLRARTLPSTTTGSAIYGMSLSPDSDGTESSEAPANGQRFGFRLDSVFSQVPSAGRNV